MKLKDIIQAALVDPNKGSHLGMTITDNAQVTGMQIAPNGLSITFSESSVAEILSMNAAVTDNDNGINIGSRGDKLLIVFKDGVKPSGRLLAQAFTGLIQGTQFTLNGKSTTLSTYELCEGLTEVFADALKGISRLRDEGQTALVVSLNHSIGSLSDIEKQALYELASVDGISRVTTVSPEIRSKLIGLALIKERGDGSLDMHDSIRDYVLYALPYECADVAITKGELITPQTIEPAIGGSINIGGKQTFITDIVIQPTNFADREKQYRTGDRIPNGEALSAARVFTVLESGKVLIEISKLYQPHLDAINDVARDFFKDKGGIVAGYDDEKEDRFCKWFAVSDPKVAVEFMEYMQQRNDRNIAISESTMKAVKQLITEIGTHGKGC